MPIEAGVDAAIDAGHDAGPDGAMDASADAGDAAPDAAMDGGGDAAPDGGTSCTEDSDCTAPDVTAARCAGGSCVIDSCTAGYGDCDLEFATGCEHDLRDDALNCGVCGGSCGLGGTCASSACDVVTGFEVGTHHHCFTRSSGVVLCAAFGTPPFIRGNDYGQLGRSTIGGGIIELLTFEPVMMLSDAVDVSLGPASTCAVRAGGQAVCVGHNGNGEVGAGTAVANYTLPVDVAGLGDATLISAGGAMPASFPTSSFACALRTGGVVSCWGSELYRGDGGTGPSTAPVDVTSLTDGVDIAAGVLHVCAVKSGGSVVCWGAGGPWLGPLGATDTNSPVVVSGITDAIQIDSALRHSCATRTGGGVYCWGSNAAGQLGVDPSVTTESAAPVAVAGITDAVAVEVSEGHSCALLTGGGVRCWGSNANGELGNGMMGTNSFTPVDVTGLTARSLMLGAGRSCAVRTNGALACWGGTSGLYGAPGASTPWQTPTDHPFFPPTPTP